MLEWTLHLASFCEPRTKRTFLKTSCGYAKLLYIAKFSSHVQTVLLAKSIAMRLPTAVAADAWHTYLGLLSTRVKLPKHTYADRMQRGQTPASQIGVHTQLSPRWYWQDC